MSGTGWTDILQGIGIVAALFFTGWEIRVRAREQKLRNYMDAISGSVDLAKLMVENPHLHALYEYSPGDWGKMTYDQLTSEEKARVLYCDLIVALCETVWLAAQEGFLSEDEWPYWQRWAHELNQAPAFRWALNWVKDDYDPDFLSEMRLRAPTPV
jgi:hypothetical protein